MFPLYLSNKPNRFIVRLLTSVVVVIVVSFLSLAAAGESSTEKPKKIMEIMSTERIIYSLDFAQDSNTNARAWLEEKDFEFKKDAVSQRKLSLSFAKAAMVLEAKKELFGLILNRKLKLENPKK